MIYHLMAHIIELRFYLYSNFLSIQKLESFSSMIPTSTCKIGARTHGEHGAISKSNIIGFHILKENDLLEEHLSNVTPAIFEICNNIVESGFQVASQLSVIITIDPRSEESIPSCHFPGEWLLNLGKIGSEIDVDIYSE